jgi:hypothetical protein
MVMLDWFVFTKFVVLTAKKTTQPIMSFLKQMLTNAQIVAPYGTGQFINY